MLKTLRSMHKACGGMAAAEFALILPAMLVLVFGSIEVTNALTCKTDVSNAASTGADLIAQESSVGASDLLATYSALGSLVYPNAMGKIKIFLKRYRGRGRKVN